MKSSSVGQPSLPNLIIIGARKAATSSMHMYLGLHPQINMSKAKELSFFDNSHRNWKKGVSWYKINFDDRYEINGESSPQYSRFPKICGVPERMRGILGHDIKIMYMVRDPVERILSDYVQIQEWKQLANWGSALLPWYETVKNIENHEELYIKGSSYFCQIQQYLKYFPRENIFVIVQERLEKNVAGVMQKVFRFLGVDDNFCSPEFDRRVNEARLKRHQAAWFRKWAPSWLKAELDSGARLPWPVNRAIVRLSRMGAPIVEKPNLREADDIKLQRLLRNDVTEFRKFLEDPLCEWRPYS